MSNQTLAVKPPTFSAGDWVEVRSKEEILATLDAQGRLAGMPFMPEMFAFCGRRFRVWKRAHKTCDTVNRTGGLRLADAVHLEETRCTGLAHGGCQAGCLLFWKNAWLKPVDGPGETTTPNARPAPAGPPAAATARGCTEEAVLAAACVSPPGDPDPTYACQATLLPSACTPLKWWDVRQYIEDFTSGNEKLGALFVGFLYSSFNRITRYVGGPTLRALYDRFQKWRGGVPYPRRMGTVPDGQPTPNVTLNLQPGECVQVKSFDEILSTLDGRNRNRGLYFDAEEVPYCGKTFRVRNRVSRIVNEQTGKMMVFKNESVLLEGAYCQARYSEKRMFCPRAIYPMWREAWLKRVADGKSATPAPAPAKNPAKI